MRGFVRFRNSLVRVRCFVFRSRCVALSFLVALFLRCCGIVRVLPFRRLLFLLSCSRLRFSVGYSTLVAFVSRFSLSLLVSSSCRYLVVVFRTDGRFVDRFVSSGRSFLVGCSF